MIWWTSFDDLVDWPRAMATTRGLSRGHTWVVSKATRKIINVCADFVKSENPSNCAGVGVQDSGLCFINQSYQLVLESQQPHKIVNLLLTIPNSNIK